MDKREHGGWNRCRACKHDGPCPCSGEPCCDRFLLCGHCPEAPGHGDECCVLSEPNLLIRAEQRGAQKALRDFADVLRPDGGYGGSVVTAWLRRSADQDYGPTA